MSRHTMIRCGVNRLIWLYACSVDSTNTTSYWPASSTVSSNPFNCDCLLTTTTCCEVDLTVVGVRTFALVIMVSPPFPAPTNTRSRPRDGAGLDGVNRPFFTDLPRCLVSLPQKGVVQERGSTVLPPKRTRTYELRINESTNLEQKFHTELTLQARCPEVGATIARIERIGSRRSCRANQLVVIVPFRNID